MLATLKLYNKNISPKNLPIFESEEDRETFFSDYDKIYQNISYNGTRNIRLKLNSIESNLEYYNYAVIEWTINGKQVKYYCFIDGTAFVNDNVAEIYLTLDYVTTFYFYIKLNEFNIRQISISQVKNENILIKNRVNSIYEKNNITDFIFKFKPSDTALTPSDLTVKFLCITIADDVETDYPIYVNNATKSTCLIFPYFYSASNDFDKKFKTYNELDFLGVELFKVYFTFNSRSGNNIIKTCSLKSILDTFDGKIKNISIIDNFFHTEYIEKSLAHTEQGEIYNNSFWKDVTSTTDLVICWNADDGNFYVNLASDYIGDTSYYFKQHTTGYDDTGFVFFTDRIVKRVTFDDNLDKSIIKRYYKYYEIVNNSGSVMSQFSLNDFNIEEVKSDRFAISADIIVDPVFPNPYYINVFLQEMSAPFDYIYPINEDLKNIKVNNKANSIVFSQTAWGEYVVNNSASVMDSLNTKHAYDIEEANLKRQSGLIQTAASLAGGVSNIGAKYWLDNDFAVSGAISGGVNALNSILSTVYSYRIAENNIEKENALLQISYNDIKSKPNNYYNFGVGNNLETLAVSGISFVEYIPTEYCRGIISNYHMEYGYNIDFILATNGTPLDLNTIIKTFVNENEYCFIRLESDFVIKDIPLFARKMLSDAFKDGIKFYPKDKLLNISDSSYSSYISTNDF